MFDTIFGLPLHPLIVHATEVVVPAAALVVLLAALWPRFRRWSGFLPLGLALAALVLVPLARETGEKLKDRVVETALVETHSEMAEGLLPWVAGLVVVAAMLLWWNYRATVGRTIVARAPKWVAIVLAVAALIAATGTTVQAVRIGHSGAAAVWSEVGGVPAPPNSDDD
ncbi:MULTISPECIES: DUF2231 domain-containing protein [Cryobacterium]|uniref:DUF2231 domain-containing protein n=1 Tax=Cryobacterium breve TaxID=1259258 RepID=A0ABY2IZG7_9MICO|nr:MULTISPECIES: DUF2231 domain-containing protein [Cryobacterium]TFC93894.1 hypothetical protein E3T20_09570 [Cryobacterium sp. TmT3-12]TFC97632.1 hypothetical protein E3O65_12815 [Cryobacterium breve]